MLRFRVIGLGKNVLACSGNPSLLSSFLLKLTWCAIPIPNHDLTRNFNPTANPNPYRRSKFSQPVTRTHTAGLREVTFYDLRGRGVTGITQSRRHLTLTLTLTRTLNLTRTRTRTRTYSLTLLLPLPYL